MYIYKLSQLFNFLRKLMYCVLIKTHVELLKFTEVLYHFSKNYYQLLRSSNNNCKIPTDYKVRKPAAHFDCTANFDSSRNLDLMAADIADNSADIRFGWYTVHFGIVVGMDKLHLFHCCTGKSTVCWQWVVVVH